MPKVTIYTQAYNPGEYLKPCIESVLNQTYTDFEWILVDNASTDATPGIIDAYAENDRRIIPVHIKENTPLKLLFYKLLRERGSGEYVTYLDSDDWWDLDYLEKLVPFAEENDLDLALTGAVFYFQSPGISEVMRQLAEPVIVTLDEFAQNFPIVGPFAGAFWGSLRSMKKVLEMEDDPEENKIFRKLEWRYDTLVMLSYVERCRRIGVNEYAPYHYRRYGMTLSRRYTNTYFKSNKYFYHRLKEFFYSHNAWNEKIMAYLNQRYFFEMNMTVDVLKGAALPASEKMRICTEIVNDPLTVELIPYDNPDQKEWRGHLLSIAKDAVFSGQFSDLEVLRNLLRPLAPDCWDVVTDAGLELFRRKRDLLPLLFQNNRQALTKGFLELIEKEEEPERYDLGTMLRSVLPEGSPLRAVEDVRFFKRYPDLTELILGSGYLVALDRMTGLLLGETPVESEESFLQLYLTLAALENQVSAFLFGKLRLAELLRRENRLTECRGILADLEEMGADFPEITALKERCGEEKPS